MIIWHMWRTVNKMGLLIKRLIHNTVCQNCELLYAASVKDQKLKCALHTEQEFKKYIHKLTSNGEIVLSVLEHNNLNTVITAQPEYTYNEVASINFYAYSHEIGGLKRKQTLYAKVWIQENHLWIIKIIDFLGEVNRGYGSLVMKAFLDYIKQFPVEKVIGWLSPVDYGQSEDYKEMLIHFYTKFGFTVTTDYNIFLDLYTK